MAKMDVIVPDLGNFKDVPVVEVLVAVGDSVEVDTPLVTLETDKASIDVPSSTAGRVTEILVFRGAKVSKGSLIVRLEASDTSAATAPVPVPVPVPVPALAPPTPPAPAPAAAAQRPAVAADREVPLLVLGAGPGGYTAAFRAADLGLGVVLVERWPSLGGVCLNVGCIPSKALLHAAKVIDEAAAMAAHGISFGLPRVDLPKLRDWKNGVVRKLTGGLRMLARQRKVEVVQGVGRFVAPNVVEIAGEGGTQRIAFQQCIVAAGSETVRLPFVPDDPRVMDSTAALELESLPKKLLVIGGGIIGLEMACVYHSLGVEVSVVELSRQLIPGCDVDLVRPLEKRIKARYAQILLGTKVTAVEARKDGLLVSFEGAGAPPPQSYDKILVAVGRVPNGRAIGAEAAGLQLDARGVRHRRELGILGENADVVGARIEAEREGVAAGGEHRDRGRVGGGAGDRAGAARLDASGDARGLGAAFEEDAAAEADRRLQEDVGHGVDAAVDAHVGELLLCVLGVVGRRELQIEGEAARDGDTRADRAGGGDRAVEVGAAHGRRRHGDAAEARAARERERDGGGEGAARVPTAHRRPPAADVAAAKVCRSSP